MVFFNSSLYYPSLVGASALSSFFFPPAGFALFAAGGTARFSHDARGFVRNLLPNKIYIPFCGLLSLYGFCL